MIGFPLDATLYTAEALGAWFGTRTRGVFSAEDCFAVTANGDFSVNLGPGLGWLKVDDYWGLVLLEKEDATLTPDLPDGVLDRIDTVCLQYDKNANKTKPVLKKGTYASEPVITAPVRDVNYDEIYVASIRIRAGATEILPSDISDLRLDEAYCGIMRDGVTGIPTQVLQNSWQDWYNRIKEQYETWWADQHDTSGYVTANNIYTYFAPIVQQIGNGADKEFTITHNFRDMKYPDVKLVVTATGEEVIPDNTYLSETAVKVSFDEYVPAENEFTVIVRR